MKTLMQRNEKATAQCDNCGWQGLAGQTDPEISDLDQRIFGGETVPVGECPECQCLCHENKGVIANAHRLFHELKTLIDHIENDGHGGHTALPMAKQTISLAKATGT